MNCFRRSAGLLLPAFVLAAMVVPLRAQQGSILGPQDYSAVMVIHTGGKTIRQNVAKRGLKYRQIMQIPGRPPMTTLMMLDTHKMYMIMSPQMCMESPLGQMPPLAQLQQEAKKQGHVKDLGPATITVGGHSYATEHLRMTYTTKKGQTFTSDVWTANALHHFPVQIETPDGKTRITYQNIKLSSPSAALFIPPANCHSMGGMGRP